MAVEEIQPDLDEFILFYKTQRALQGYRAQGDTLPQAIKHVTSKEELPSPDIRTTYPQSSTAKIEVAIGEETTT